VLKSGCRYNDERAVLEPLALLDSKLEVVDLDAKVKQKESKVKSSFKIEIEESEKKARDSTVTTQYHTGSATGITLSLDD
jgi:hypothetical protein